MTDRDFVDALAEALERVLPQATGAAPLNPGRFGEILPGTMTADEVGDLEAIRLSGKRVRELARQGRFPGAYQQGTTWMFPRESVLLYLHALQRETAQAHGFEPLVEAEGGDGTSIVVRHEVTVRDSAAGRPAAPPAPREDEWTPDAELDWDAYREECDE